MSIKGSTVVPTMQCAPQKNCTELFENSFFGLFIRASKLLHYKYDNISL